MPRAQFLPRGHRARIALPAVFQTPLPTLPAPILQECARHCGLYEQDPSARGLLLCNATAFRERFCKRWRGGTNLSLRAPTFASIGVKSYSSNCAGTITCLGDRRSQRSEVPRKSERPRRLKARVAPSGQPAAHRAATRQDLLRAGGPSLTSSDGRQPTVQHCARSRSAN